MARSTSRTAEALADLAAIEGRTQGIEAGLWAGYRDLLFCATEAEDPSVLDRILAALGVSRPPGPRPEDAEALGRIRAALKISDEAHAAHVKAVSRYVHLVKEKGPGAAFFAGERVRLEADLEKAFAVEDAARRRRILCNEALAQASAAHFVALRAEGWISDLCEKHPALFVPAAPPAD